MLLAMFWQRGRDGSVMVWRRRCDVSNLQRATRGHPGEVLVEEVAFGVLIQGHGGEESRIFSPVFVLRDVRDHVNGGCSFIDELVGKGDAHRTGSDIARCAARWGAFGKNGWVRSVLSDAIWLSVRAEACERQHIQVAILATSLVKKRFAVISPDY